MRKFFVFSWFYFIPFVALSLNFIVPYFVAKKRESEKAGMDDEYKNWLQNQLNQGD